MIFISKLVKLAGINDKAVFVRLLSDKSSCRLIYGGITTVIVTGGKVILESAFITYTIYQRDIRDIRKDVEYKNTIVWRIWVSSYRSKKNGILQILDRTK